jgi:predicted MFS family arabinose efflux permease
LTLRKSASPGAVHPGLLGLIYAAAFVDRALVGAAGGPIKHDLALTDTQFGFASGTAFALLFCLCSLPMGWLADRVNRRRLLALGILFWSAMTIGCGASRTWGQFASARVGVGLGEACLLPAGMSLIVDSVSPARRARAVALFLMGATTGNAAAFIGGGYLLTHGVSWRMLFLGAGSLGLSLAGLVVLGREPARQGQAGGSIRSAVRHILAHPKAYGLLTGAVACCIALTQAQAAWIPQFFSRRFGLANGDAALATGIVFMLAAPSGQWLGGSFIDRLRSKGIGAPPNLVLATCCAASLPLAAIFCTADSFPLSIAAYSLFVFTAFAATPAGLSGWQALTPASNQGFTTALLASAATLAAIGLGPLSIGVLADRWSLGLGLLATILASGTAGCVLGLAGCASFAAAKEVVSQ